MILETNEEDVCLSLDGPCAVLRMQQQPAPKFGKATLTLRCSLSCYYQHTCAGFLRRVKRYLPPAPVTIKGPIKTTGFMLALQKQEVTWCQHASTESLPAKPHLQQLL